MSHFYTWPYARVIAHRGGGVLGPENTMAGFETGLTYGYHAVEFDAVLSKDEIPVLMHDEKFGRCVKRDGKVSDLTYQEIKALEAGAWLDAKFEGASPAGFEEAILFLQNHGSWCNIEIKPASGFERRTGELVAQETARLYAQELAEQREQALFVHPKIPLMSSFKKEALLACRQAQPELPRAFLMDNPPSRWQQELQEVGALSLNTNWKNLTQSLAKEVKAAGYWLFCYTVNDPEVAAKLLDWGVDAFCTDRIDLIGDDFADLYLSAD